MSSRYTLYSIDALRDRFAPSSGVPKGVRPSYNISPAASVPVIVSRDGVRQIETMKWGFIPSAAKDTNSIFRYKTYIARSEGIFDKPTWATAIRTQRCLIPADGYYEWKMTGDQKNPYYIQPTDKKVFAFAGVYGTWTDPDGTTWGMCSMITTNSATESDMLPSRLPVIVHPDDESDWLNPDVSDINTLYKIMRPFEHDQLSIIRVGDAVNSVKPNTASLINKYERP
jgi:putative SOS response-associated peptidase YedK